MTVQHLPAIRDKSMLLNVCPNNPPTTTTLPDHSILQSTLQGNLPIQTLSQTATHTKLFKTLDHSLISLGTTV